MLALLTYLVLELRVDAPAADGVHIRLTGRRIWPSRIAIGRWCEKSAA